MSGNHVKDRHRGGASPRGDKRQKSAPTREQEERLLDVRAHEVPKKLSESSSSSHSSSALRKGSMATLFKESFFSRHLATKISRASWIRKNFTSILGTMN